MKQGKHLAQAVFNATSALATHVGIAHKDVALDGMYCAVNTLGGDAWACCDRLGRGIVLGRPPGALGHEWVHAMEDWVDNRSASKELKKKLQKLRDVAISPPQDTKECRLWIEEQKTSYLREVVEDFIEYKGSVSAKAMFAKEGAVPKLLWEQLEESLAAKTQKNASTRLAAVLEKWCNPQKTINKEAVVRLVGEHFDMPQKINRLGRMLEEGVSLFEMDARERDLRQNKNYWDRADERLARSAEAYFSTAGNPILGFASKSDKAVPHGLEFEACDRAFSEFNKSLCAAMSPEKTLTDRLAARRAKSAPTPSKVPALA
jgi:hypothetical protein